MELLSSPGHCSDGAARDVPVLATVVTALGRLINIFPNMYNDIFMSVVCLFFGECQLQPVAIFSDGAALAFLLVQGESWSSAHQARTKTGSGKLQGEEE